LYDEITIAHSRELVDVIFRQFLSTLYRSTDCIDRLADFTDVAYPANDREHTNSCQQGLANMTPGPFPVGYIVYEIPYALSLPEAGDEACAYLAERTCKRYIF
jgi:hypothetical protein